MPIRLDASAARKSLDLIVDAVRVASGEIVTGGAAVIQARAAAKLHTGYGVVTGTMRRSGHVEGPLPKGTDSVYAKVGPGIIYARRFELGYTGPDRLGRRFNDPPRPYWKPAYVESEDDINTLAANRWSAAVKGVTG